MTSESKAEGETWVRVTVKDLATGEEEVVEIMDDYVLIAVGECRLEHTNLYANGTHILTIKGSKGKKRNVESAAEQPGNKE